MRNLTLRMKLIAGFGCLVFVLIVMAVAAYLSVSRLAESAREFDSVVHREDLVRHMETGLEKTMNGLRGFVLVGNEDLLNHYEEGRREYQESADEISRLLTTTEGKKHFSDIATGYNEYHSIQEKTIQLRRAGNTKGAVDLLFDPHSNELRSALQRSLSGMIDIANRLKNDSRQRQQQTEGAMRVVAISLAAIGLGLGVVVALLMSRSILVRIGSMLSMIQQVAANNLATEDVEVTSQDELGQASSALNSMKNNLNVIMQSIASTAEQVASASEEISANATQMANGSEAQKDQVRQVATAMQEMSATVHEVSENSNQAADSARQTAETARQGGAIVEDTLGHMRSIAGSVRETAQKVPAGTAIPSRPSAGWSGRAGLQAHRPRPRPDRHGGRARSARPPGSRWRSSRRYPCRGSPASGRRRSRAPSAAGRQGVGWRRSRAPGGAPCCSAGRSGRTP